MSLTKHSNLIFRNPINFSNIHIDIIKFNTTIFILYANFCVPASIPWVGNVLGKEVWDNASSICQNRMYN